MNWLCWHVGTVTDPKFVTVARRCHTTPANVIALWAVLLERAAQAEERGTFGKIDPEDCAICTGIDEETIGGLLAAFDAKALTRDGKIVNWDRRQLRPSTYRVRKHREKLRGDETGETVSVTCETQKHIEERRGEERIKDSKTQTLLQRVPMQKMNGHSGDSRAGGLPRSEKKAMWEQGCQNWMRLHWPDARALAANYSYLAGESHGREEYERANAERRAAIAAGRARE